MSYSYNHIYILRRRIIINITILQVQMLTYISVGTLTELGPTECRHMLVIRTSSRIETLHVQYKQQTYRDTDHLLETN